MKQNSHNSKFAGKRILVTGGTGFIGGRLVERLVMDHGASVRVLVRNFSKASRIGRLPVEMIPGDLLKQTEIKTAVKGCDYIFHCAVAGFESSEEKQKHVNVDGTKHLMEAAQKDGVKRVVYVSTAMVYGFPPEGDLDESTPRRPDTDIYSLTKTEAENLVMEYARVHSVPAVVLQPTNVYGPYAMAWTLNPLWQLKNKRVILVNGGDGLCNAVYVDDLVSAMLLSAIEKKAIGEAFLISGPSPVTWKEFYGKFEEILGYSSTVEMSAARALDYFAKKRSRKSLFKEAWAILKEEHPVRWRIRDSREVDAIVKVGKAFLPGSVRSSLISRIRNLNGAAVSSISNGSESLKTPVEKPVLPLGPASIQFYSSKVRIRINKAQEVLGYAPRFDLNAGMQRVAQWAKWAQLL
ncbi:MAG: NAD-dependent epimerase/dehydratase family protein [Calditrichaeota bacterium]|nr:NAD-dependent epimerase/dehydratase family protein [Calditrichota bacterium]